MCKGKAKVSGLYHCLISHLEDRLEPDALLSNVRLCATLGGFTNIADCRQVLLGEAILIALDNNAMSMNLEKHKRLFFSLCRSAVVVVIAVLKQLE